MESPTPSSAVRHLCFFCAGVSSQPPWRQPGPWSKPAAPPSGTWPMGRCQSAHRWRRSCCSSAMPRCPDACDPCSSPWSPTKQREREIRVLHITFTNSTVWVIHEGSPEDCYLIPVAFVLHFIHKTFILIWQSSSGCLTRYTLHGCLYNYSLLQ